MKTTTIGVDIAKRAFQAHGVDAAGRVALRRKLGRAEVSDFLRALPPCLIGIEACGTAHLWAREIQALGHEVRLIPAAYVKPYVKRGKTDAADAEAIREAVTRPTMRFMPVKSPEQQAVPVLHRTRDLLVRQRTVLVNALRGQLAEFGIVARQGTGGVGKFLATLRAEETAGLPALAKEALLGLADQIEALEARVAEVEAAILIGDVSNFRSARHLAAWIGLVPKQHSTGGKPRQVGIFKAEDRYLRKLLVLGATNPHGSHALGARTRRSAPGLPLRGGADAGPRHLVAGRGAAPAAARYPELQDWATRTVQQGTRRGPASRP